MITSEKTNEELLLELNALQNRLSDLQRLHAIKSSENVIIASKLEKSKRINDFLSDSYLDGFVIREDGKTLFFSKNHLSFLGYESKIMADLTLEQLYPYVHPEDLPNIKDTIASAKKNKTQLFNLVYRFRDINNKYVWVETNIKFDFESTDSPTRSTYVTKDITHRVNAEEAFKKNEAKYRFLTEHSSDVIWHLDKDYRCDYISLADEKLRGYRQEEVIGTPLFDILRPEAVEMLKKNIGKRIADEKMGLPVAVPHYELEEKCKDGSWVWVESTANPEYDENGNSIGLHGVTRNITERKKAEAELKLRTEQLEIAIADKDRFMSILAHDLRGPFGSILGFLDLLSNNLRVFDVDQIETYVNVALDSTQRTFNLLEDLLLWGQAQSGKLPFNRQELCLQTILYDIMAVLDTSAQAKGIVVNNLVRKGSIVYADSNMLKTILRNLISNAIKFTHPGGEIKLLALLSSEGITVSVADNGVGIKSDALEELFNMKQIYTTRGTANESGTGLGLFLCKEFVEKHNGKIWAESYIDTTIAPRGSIFTIAIPGK